MIFLDKIRLIEALGWTLLHSFWQGAFIALALFTVLKLMKTSKANSRSSAACVALLLLTLVPTATFISQLKNEVMVSQIADGVFDERERDAENLPLKTVDVTAERKLFLPDLNNRTTSSQASIAENLVWIENRISVWLPVLVFVWFGGVSWQILRLGFGFHRISRLRRDGLIPVPDELCVRFDKIKRILKINQKIELLQSVLVGVPVTLGWFKPVIIIPMSAFLYLSPQELEMIIQHELEHIRRYDYLVNAAQSIVETILFYHPAAWWISSVIRREREYACDDAVVFRGTDENNLTYARALANLEQNRLSAQTTSSPLVLAANGSGGKLSQRIKRIIEPHPAPYSTNSTTTAPLVSGLILLLVTVLLFYSVGISQLNKPLTSGNAIVDKTKKLAIGFVSIPPLERSGNQSNDSEMTMRLMITKLLKHKVPAVGFVQGSMISDGEKLSPLHADIVRLWRDAGLEIGIGNFRHVLFYDTPYEDYIAGVEKNAQITKKILAEKNQTLKFFSYPYLNTGKSPEDHLRFEAWLQAHDLRSVPYTIDNQEWMYSYAYDQERLVNDTEKMKQIKTEFLHYMSEMFDHYEAYSQALFGRDINQTMVLTPSRLVADSADELFGLIEKRGYNFVSMDEALKDEAYQTPENFSGKSGISWFERWQMGKGSQLLEEPKVSHIVSEIWEARTSKK